jgi:hypothetical protein
MEVSNVTKVVTSVPMPPWAQIAFIMVFFLVAVAVFVLVFFQNADEKTRARYGLGKKGQGK